MLTLLFLFALNVTTPAEMTCMGSVKAMIAPMDLYVAGVQLEGTETLATQPEIVYLNGPNVASLKAGTIQRVIRPEEKIRDPRTGVMLGFYYKDIGTVRIEAVQRESAIARIMISCQEMMKGDLVIPFTKSAAVNFNGDLSNALTPLPPDGLVGSVVLGKDDIRDLASGNFCFIGLGRRDGVKRGDRLTVFRPNPAFNSSDMAVEKNDAFWSSTSMRDLGFRLKMNSLLRNRTLPPRVLGDIIVVEAGESVSTGKIINSLEEIHLGDLVVKR